MLADKGRVSDAEKSLCWLRGWVDPPQVQMELSELVASLTTSNPNKSETSKSSWRNYTRRTFLLPYCLVSAGFFFGHFAGMTTLQTYAVRIFAMLGAPIDKYLATLYLGLVELAGSLVCVVLVHWTGKRPLTFFSTAGNGLCYIVVATYAFCYPQMSEILKSYDWLPMTFLIGSAFLSHIGIRLLPWILIGEVYPSEVRGVASGASGSIGYIFGFAANKTYLHMLETLTLPGTFWFYGVVSLTGTILFYFFLPETEGRTLHEIQEHFAGVRNLMKEHKVNSKNNVGNGTVKEKWSAVNPAMVPEAESHL